MSVRGFAGAAIVGLPTWLVLEALHLVDLVGPVIPLTMAFAIVLPMMAALNVDAIQRFGYQQVAVPAWVPYVMAVGGLVWAAGSAFEQSALRTAAVLLLAVACTVYSIRMMKANPKATLLTDDPLTKGDDVCFKQLLFAHRFLPIAMLVLLAAAITDIWSPGWAMRLALSGGHILFVGFGLLSLYGVSHLWVPRFSGVPAIAKGAIKGELHTSLLGIVGLTIGFMTGIRGILAGLGFFVFVGFFTFMGVLGANMMRNKSKTQRVTPEFIYIPWVFTGIFWLICAVLMGLFLNAVPDVLANRFGDLRDMHVAAAFIGGFVQIVAGLLTRSLTNEPLRFQGNQRLAFFAFNIGLVLWITGAFNDSISQAAVGLALLAISFAAFARSVVKLMPAAPRAAA